MRKKFLTITLFVFLMLFGIMSGGAARDRSDFPAPVGLVNDFADVIPPEYKRSMNDLSRAVLEKTGVAMVVATFPDIGDNPPDDFANRLYQAWGIGKKGEDKGVLLFLAVKQRKIRIETGYGVEGILPDGLVGEILDQEAIPYLRKGDYGEGLLRPMTAIARVISKDAGIASPDSIRKQPQEGPRSQFTWREKLWIYAFLIIVLPLLLFTRTGRYILLGMLLSGGRGGGGGGFGGFGGGGFGGFGGGSSGGGGAGRGF